MSTVNREIADRVIAGEFSEDNIIAIVQYENMFNGNFSYKLVYKGQEEYMKDMLEGNIPSMGAPTLYYQKKEI